jgi:hypothetical protein
MSRTGTKAQDARARAREARLTLLADRNAQDERIEAAVAAALLRWEDRTAAAGKVPHDQPSVLGRLQSFCA